MNWKKVLAKAFTWFIALISAGSPAIVLLILRITGRVDGWLIVWWFISLIAALCVCVILAALRVASRADDEMEQRARRMCQLQPGPHCADCELEAICGKGGWE